MSPSALFGQPPASDDDYYVIKGFLRQFGLPDNLIHPEMGIMFPIKAPGPGPYSSNSAGIIAGSSIAIALITFITGTRLYLRIFRRDLKVGLDDVFIGIAALGAVTWLALTICIATIGGAGKHIYAVTYHELWWFFRLAAICQTLFWPIMGFTNIAITLFNRRLTGLTSERWQYAHFTFLTLVSIYIVIAFFLNLLECHPPYTVQYSLISFGKAPVIPTCLAFNPLGISLSVIHIIFQFSLLTVPLVILYVIKMSLWKKIRLGFLFSVGSVACIGAVMRQVLQKQNNPDITGVFHKQWAWTVVDLFFTVVAASLPVLNAAIPARWRSPPATMQQLGNLSILRRSKDKGSVKLNSNEVISRPDGTVDNEAIARDAEHGENGVVEKDSFTRKTEKRWDEAFENSRKSVSAGTAH